MFSLFFGGFGLSTLWLARPVWRLLTLLRRRGSPGGSGAIRFWLGALAVLLASATLEGTVLAAITSGGEVGGSICRTLASGLGGVFGAPLTALLMLAVLGLTLPWYLGRPWKDAMARATDIIEPLGAWVIDGTRWLADRVLRRASGVRRVRGGAVRRGGQQARTRRAAPVPRVVEPSPKPPSPVREHVIDEPWLLPKAAREGASPAYRPARPRPPAVSTAAIVAAAQVSQRRRVAEPLPVMDEAPAPADVPAMPEEAVPEAVYLPEPQASSVAPVRMRGYAANDDASREDNANEGRLQETRADAVAPVSFVAPTLRVRPAPRLPALTLLAVPRQASAPIEGTQLAETGELIEQRLREFKVPVTVVGASAGPVITRFEVEPATGVRGNQIVALMKDLARGLGRSSIRVVETIPGKTCMGLELPNEQRQMIALSEILDSPVYRDADSLLTLAMGKGITGEPVVADLARAPHMLVAGTTGSGKSVAVNAMILSMLYKATPDDVRMIMIDPKMLELSVYEGIPHLLAPVVTDMKLAANALNWCVAEMENRYRLMSELRVRNLAGYNQKVRDAKVSGRPLMNPFPAHPEIPETLDTLPLIVVVIDELADLMMVAGKKIEELIARLAQKARAAGIHLILATQRPSVDVITGLIKANIPTRVAFQVSSKIDSRTILDQMGAESLLGQGDMLFLPPGTGYPQRIHGAFVADEEVHRVVTWLKQFGEPDYKDEILAGPPSEGSGELFAEEGGDAELDPLYDEAAAFVLRTRRASISFVQRQFRIGYNRAARLVEAMEAAGLVSSMGINGQRDVIAPAPTE